MYIFSIYVCRIFRLKSVELKKNKMRLSRGRLTLAQFGVNLKISPFCGGGVMNAENFQQLAYLFIFQIMWCSPLMQLLMPFLLVTSEIHSVASPVKPPGWQKPGGGGIPLLIHWVQCAGKKNRGMTQRFPKVISDSGQRGKACTCLLTHILF